MSYQYTDSSRETEPTALPDVEVFESTPKDMGQFPLKDATGWYYAFGFPGCLWDSDPVGPFETEAEALVSAREAAGF